VESFSSALSDFGIDGAATHVVIVAIVPSFGVAPWQRRHVHSHCATLRVKTVTHASHTEPEALQLIFKWSLSYYSSACGLPFSMVVGVNNETW
jgi:hypothetical protein